jgi:RecB family endonuclease NucS
MAIIIRKTAKTQRSLEKSGFDGEASLQQYIYDNPDSIPLYDIKEGIRLFVAAREFPTNSGPIDAIGFDNGSRV